MYGNVWELVKDWSGDYPTSLQVDWSGPSSGSGRVMRGGSLFSYAAENVRLANRFYERPDHRRSDVGFRLARTVH